MLVTGRHDDKVRENAEIGEVEHTVVRRPVGAHDAGAVQKHRNGQVLQRDFLEDLIVGPLQERAIDIDDRTQACLGHAGRHGDGVRFADADVEEAVGELVANRLEHVALAHGGRDDHRARAFAAHLRDERIAGDRRVRPRRAALESDRAVAVRERRRRVEGNRVLRRRVVAVAFFRDHMQQHGADDLLGHVEIALQLPDVVPIDRTVVMETELLEKHAADEPSFNSILHLVQEPLDRIADDRHADEHLLHFGLDAVVERVRADAIERLGQPADARADRHLVVVEDDDEVLFHPARVIQGLEHDARTERSIAHDGHGIAVFFGPQQVIGTSQADDAACRAAGVAGEEEVVFAFGRVGIAHRAAAEADVVEILVAAGDQLVRIDLMARVPDQAIAAEIEAGMQRERQLDDAQVRGEMGRAPRAEAKERLADFGGQIGQLLEVQPQQVGRRVDRGKNLVHQRSLSKTYWASVKRPSARGPSGSTAAEASEINCDA